MVRLCNTDFKSNLVEAELTLNAEGSMVTQGNKSKSSSLPRHADTPIYPCVGFVCCATYFPASSMYMCSAYLCNCMNGAKH